MIPEPAPWIRAHAAQLGLQPTSITDSTARATLHPTIVKTSANGHRRVYEMLDEERFIFKPANLYIVKAAEPIRCPDTHTCLITTLPELAMKGVSVLQAEWASNGTLTGIALQTVVPVELNVGQSVFQLTYSRRAAP
jgi:deoxycytidine triphosphate deaminase